MKKIKYIIVAVIAITFTGAGCKKQFGDYANNPNLPQSVPAYLLLCHRK